MTDKTHPLPLVYLTVNDGPSGVYSGQVIDVVRFLREQCGIATKLVALVPAVLFRKHRRVIRSQLSDAVVLPMFPKLRNWKLNVIQLCIVLLFSRRCSIIARSPLAA